MSVIDSDRPAAGADQADPGRPEPTSAQRLLSRLRWHRIRVVGDLLLAATGTFAAMLAAPSSLAGSNPPTVVWALPPLIVVLLALSGDYRQSLQIRILDQIGRVVGVTSLVAISLVAAQVLVSPDTRSAGLIARAWLFATLYLAGGRVLLGVTQRRAQENGIVARPTLIVGAGWVGAQVERRLRRQRELGLWPTAYLDADPVASELLPGRDAPVIGAPADLPRVATETGAKSVVLAFGSTPDHLLLPLVRDCDRLGLEVFVVPRLFESINGRVELEHVGGLPLLRLKTAEATRWQSTVKHSLGWLVATGLLVLLAPVMLGAALAIKVTSGGPVLFRQLRIGRDGREFTMLKFRSMTGRAVGSEPLDSLITHVAPGGVEEGLELTPVGRFLRRTCLDEAPQLWHVVTGDMTLVGPRPERPEYAELFGQSIQRYSDRHRVKSGITGWAQVHGLRGRTSLADRIEWDNYYIENWSLWLDVKILLMTPLVVARARE